MDYSLETAVGVFRDSSASGGERQEMAIVMVLQTYVVQRELSSLDKYTHLTATMPDF